MPKLLIAEDNEFSRDMLARRLENAGFEIIPVTNGREALLAARQSQPDLILMDLEMPVMDGRAAIRGLKTDPRTFRIPIIVVTANTNADIVAEVVAAGCAGFQEKPVILRTLVARIHETLEAAQASIPEPRTATGTVS